VAAAVCDVLLSLQILPSTGLDKPSRNRPINLSSYLRSGGIAIECAYPVKAIVGVRHPTVHRPPRCY
jgi:hypothetical protein